ncbi:hypothetical protein ACLB2K_022193 [Fragaria x ananassa]
MYDLWPQKERARRGGSIGIGHARSRGRRRRFAAAKTVAERAPSGSDCGRGRSLTEVVDDLDDENGTIGPVIYEDKDSDEEESEDVMETDEDDEDDDLDADLGGVSDFEVIKGLDDLSD